jgi:hypothetical protein
MILDVSGLFMGAALGFLIPSFFLIADTEKHKWLRFFNNVCLSLACFLFIVNKWVNG